MLARLLLPEDLGLIAVAAAYAAIVDGLTELNIDKALISWGSSASRLYDTAFTIGVVRGCVIALLTMASAPVVAAAVKEPRIEAIVLVLGLAPIIHGLKNPKLMEFDRNLMFSRVAVVQLVPILASVAVTIIAALVYRNYWSLVAGTLVGTIVRVTIGYLVLPYRPGFSFHELKALFRFVSWLTGSSIIRTITRRFDRLLVGSMFGSAMAGVYHVGAELAHLPVTVGGPFNRALYPTFTMVSDDRIRLRERALDAMAMLAAIAFPIGFGFALVSEEAVLVLLGERWLQATLMIQWSAPVIAFQVVGNVADSIAMCRRETHRIFARDAVYLVVRLGLMVPAAFLAGFKGVVIAGAISGVFLGSMNIHFAGRLLRVSFKRLARATWRSVLATAVMTSVLLSISVTAEFHSLSVVNQLAVKIVAGAVIYFSSHALFWLFSGRPPGPERRILALGHQLHWRATARV